VSDTPSGPAIRRVSGLERIAGLDVLRGIAILAILLMNIPFMGGYVPPDFFDPRLVSWTPADEATFRGISLVLDGTQRGLLELLFGAGIMIMARGAMQPDAPIAIADLHFRRNLWLITFGVFQAMVLMWPGDILMPYGLGALLVFTARTWPVKWKAVAAAVLILAAIAPAAQRYADRVDLHSKVVAAQAKVEAKTPLSKAEQASLDTWKEKLELARPLAQNKKKQEAVAEEKKARLGPLADYAAFTRKTWTEINFSMVGVIGMAEIVGTMLLGMALYEWGVIQGRRSARVYLALAAIGYGIGIPLRHLATEGVLAFTPLPKPFGVTYDVARIALTLGHIGLVNLALKSGLGARILSVFQAPGRMPLTVYLSASAIGMLILFPSFGFGLFGKFGWANLTLIALAIIAVQLVFANLWMAAFESGPIDWLWKSLAYGKRQPFRKRRGPTAVAQAAE